MGEDVDEGGGVVFLQAVPQVLQHGQHNVHGVAQVQCNQDVIEAVSGLKNIKAEYFSVKVNLTSLLANMATETRLPQMPRLPIRRVAARVRCENRVKIAIRASCGSSA